MRDWKHEECGFPPQQWHRNLEWEPKSTCHEPTTMMIGSMVAGAGSSIMGGIGQQNALGAQAASSRYQAQVAENNRLIAEQNARYATMAGAGNAQAQDFQTRAQLGTARAAQGASGIDVGSGSPVEVRDSISQLGRLKTLEEIQKADLSAYGYRTQGTEFGAQAGLARMQAESAEAAKGPAMLGTILGTAASVGGKWAMYKNPYGGGFGGSGSGSFF
jgi:hypothetical protein